MDYRPASLWRLCLMVVVLLIYALIILLTVAVSWLAINLAFAALPMLLKIVLLAASFGFAWKFLLPAMQRYLKAPSPRSGKQLVSLAGITAALFVLGFPGVGFSVADNPVQQIGSAILPQYPLLGFAAIALIAAVIIHKLRRKR